jgi:4'-phosphopantetheinyl transferase
LPPRCALSRGAVHMPGSIPFVSLTAGEIHLWYCFHDESGSPDLVDACRALLAPDELAQQQRFHFARDRHRYLLTRALVRSVLSRYAAISPEGWRFQAGPFGRPRIEPAQGALVPGIDFNLSHAGGVIVMALARDLAVGVDVEAVAPRAPMEVAAEFFSPGELAALHALPPALQTDRFFALWTLKESYMKARGMGLQIPLDAISFALDDGDGIAFALAAGTDDTATRWRFWQMRPTPGHVAAVCAAPRDAAPLRLVCREAMPLRQERLLDLPVIRRSSAQV